MRAGLPIVTTSRVAVSSTSIMSRLANTVARGRVVCSRVVAGELAIAMLEK